MFLHPLSCRKSTSFAFDRWVLCIADLLESKLDWLWGLCLPDFTGVTWMRPGWSCDPNPDRGFHHGKVDTPTDESLKALMIPIRKVFRNKIRRADRQIGG